MASSADKTAELHAQQYAFAAHIRDPENQPAPANIEDRRVAIYRDLFFNNIVTFLGGNFPTLLKILGEDRWRTIIRDYYRDHQSHSPLFPDMPRDFLNYLADERPQGRCSAELPDPPFMAELAHFEWVEWGLMLAEDRAIADSINPDGNLLEQRIAIAEPAWLLGYNYPVNEISLHCQPYAKLEQPLHFLVFRDSNDKVIYSKLNAVSARLFSLLQNDTDITGRQALEIIATEMNHPDPDKVLASGEQILQRWRESGALLGTIT